VNPSPSLGLTVVLGLLLALTALGNDVFLPAVPAVATGLGETFGRAQHAVTAFLAGLALGQFLWGPLADRFGRRRALLAGLALFAAASAGCALARSLPELVTLRFVQGVAMSSGPVAARAIVRDLYVREQAARLLARMTVVFGFVPLLGPLVGAATLSAGGWRAVFVFYTAVAVGLLAAVLRRLAETAPPQRPAPGFVALAGNSLRLLGDARFLGPAATMLSVQMGILAFVSHSPVVLVNAYGVTPTQFAALFATVMLGQIAGGWLGNRWVLRRGIARLVRVGVAAVGVAGTLLAAAVHAGIGHWAAVIAPMVLFLFGAALVLPNATAAALGPFPHLAGTVSSLLGTLAFALGALVSATLAAIWAGTARPLATAVFLAAAAAYFAERRLFRRHHG